MMKRSLFVVVMIVLGSLPVHAWDGDLEDTLNRHYFGHILNLRQPINATIQQYDSQGNIFTANAPGPWTVYSRVQIRNIRLEPNRLVVEGRRIGMRREPKIGMLIPVDLKEKVTLQIALSRPLDSEEEFHAILGRIFAFSREDFLASLPEFWQGYVRIYLKTYSDDGNTMEFGISESSLKTRSRVEKAPAVSQDSRGETGPGLKKTTQAAYTSAASSQELTGHVILTITVDASGRPVNVRLLRPLGLGLDESAASTVKDWTFKPATQRGQPIKADAEVAVLFWPHD